MGRARGEEVRLRRGGEEREAGGSDMAEVREQGGGAKGGERKDGEREGFAISFWRQGEETRGGEEWSGNM